MCVCVCVSRVCVCVCQVCVYYVKERSQDSSNAKDLGQPKPLVPSILKTMDNKPFLHPPTHVLTPSRTHIIWTTSPSSSSYPSTHSFTHTHHMHNKPFLLLLPTYAVRLPLFHFSSFRPFSPSSSSCPRSQSFFRLFTTSSLPYVSTY